VARVKIESFFMSSTAIDVKNLSVAYNNDKVLEDISFSIPKGSIAVIIGPNGSGKTTLLKAMLGFVSPQSGSVSVLGGTPSKVVGKVGYVPQRFDFDKTFPITVAELLRFSYPMCSEEKFNEYLTHLEVKRMEHALIGTLSGGQLQRVLIVRAMLHEPEILYLDEPASGIDIGGEKNFFQLISHIHKKHGTTIVMVSHEIDFVYSFADQVICVNRQLLCSGAPPHTLTPQILRKLYGKDITAYPHH